MRTRKRRQWPSETAMCHAFMAEARAAGWEVHPETSGFDVVLVATDDVVSERAVPGDVVAVEAKLRCSVEVLCQALPPDERESGHAADFYAVLVPESPAVGSMRRLTMRLGIGIMRAPEPPDPDGYWRHGTSSPWDHVIEGGLHRRYDRGDRTRLWVPPVAIDLPAGCSGPRKVTRWKLSAVKFCMDHAEQTFTAAEVRAAGLNLRTAVAMGWIQVDRHGHPIWYRLTDHGSRPDRSNPEIVAALTAVNATDGASHAP